MLSKTTLSIMKDDKRLTKFIISNFKNVDITCSDGIEIHFDNTNIKKVEPIIYKINSNKGKLIILYFNCDNFGVKKYYIPKLIIDSGFDINNVKWYVCLHLDSEKNFNFHFFFMEIKKSKSSFNDRLISKNAIKKFKSNALNYLINRNDILKLKDELFINVTKEVKLQNLSKIDKYRIFKTSLEKKLNKLYKKLPKEHRLQYNSPNLNNVRPLIDSIIWDILSHPSIRKYYYDYINALHDIDRQNVQYYGVSKNNNYINNQIHKLYFKIGNDILSNYKNYKNELYLENQKEFLSKNIFKLDLKSNKDITYERKLELGQELYKIGNYLNLNKNQLKFLVKKWYFNSNLKSILMTIIMICYLILIINL